MTRRKDYIFPAGYRPQNGMTIRCFRPKTCSRCFYSAIEVRHEPLQGIEQPGDSLWRCIRIKGSVVFCCANHDRSIIFRNQVNALAKENTPERCGWLVKQETLSSQWSYRQSNS